jgi:penicillin-binding protein 1A
LLALGVLLGMLAIAGGVAAGWVLDIYNSAPPLSSLHRIEKGRSSAIYAADGSLLGFINSSNIRQPVGSRAIPQNLKDATVAIEDQNFYNHGGIDPAAIFRAAWEDLLAGGKPVQGASTITQQLVRNLYIQNPEDTIERKVTEAHLANDMEDVHSKDWILTAYLNSAPYGTVDGETAVGVEAAAETYYGKHARELRLTEAAMIAGLPQAPSAYNPLFDPKAALDRRNDVLKAMMEQGYIGPARYRTARDRGLGLTPGDKYRTIREPFLFDFVQQELVDRYGVNTVRNGGLKAYTTIDPTLQDYAQAAVDACGVCYSGGGPAAALASVDPNTGEIVALASSQGEYSEENQFNYAYQAHRQPGSSFKTFVLTTAIKQGVDPYSTYYDGTSPKTLVTPGGSTWTVNNAEGGLGVMPLSEATWDSVNVVFAQLDLDVGPENVSRTARQMGITSPLDSFPAEGIGGLRVGVTPLEMASAYGTLASGGIHHKPTAISRIEFPGGKVEQTDADSGNRVLTEGEAYEVTKLLAGVITQGTGAGYTSIGCGSEAGKTGTSEGESDAWFAGYTPMFSTAVWVGHPESRDPTGYGGPTAGPIWQSFMAAAQAGNCPAFPVPSDAPTLEALHSSNTRSASEVPSTAPIAPGTQPDDGSGDQDSEQGDEGGQGDTPQTASPPAPAPSPSPPPAVGGGLTPGGGVGAP